MHDRNDEVRGRGAAGSEGSQKVQVLTLDRFKWLPVNLQQLAHSKPQLATRAFYLWNNQVALQCEKQGITLATGDRRIHVAVMMPDLGRRPSDHDCLTILFNGLYNCGRVKAREVHPRRFRIHFEGLNWRCHDDSQTIVTMEDEG